MLFPVLSLITSVNIKNMALNLRSFLAGLVLMLKNFIPDLCLIIYLY